MKFFSLQERLLFSTPDPTGVKLLTRLRLKFSHLNEHKFCYKFKDTVVAMCVTVEQKLKKQNTFSCVAHFL